MHNVVYLTEAPFQNYLGVWISEELIDEFEAALSAEGFDFVPVEATGQVLQGGPPGTLVNELSMSAGGGRARQHRP
jgi:hypothetical protein